jgi:hypothetical protein
MIQCEGCRRYLIDDAGCPFCKRPVRSSGVRLGALVMGMMTPVVLAACYGSPYVLDTKTDSGITDVDGDGFDSIDDCDDGDADIYPGAAEDCSDGIDNDCDELIDADDPDCTGG